MATNRTSKIFGKNISRLREQFRLSQGVMAQRLGISLSSISHWEAGRSIPRGETIDKICEMFSIKPAALFDTEELFFPEITAKSPEMLLTEAIKIVNNYDGLLNIRVRHKKVYNK